MATKKKVTGSSVRAKAEAAAAKRKASRKKSSKKKVVKKVSKKTPTTKKTNKKKTIKKRTAAKKKTLVKAKPKTSNKTTKKKVLKKKTVKKVAKKVKKKIAKKTIKKATIKKATIKKSATKTSSPKSTSKKTSKKSTRKTKRKIIKSTTKTAAKVAGKTTKKVVNKASESIMELLKKKQGPYTGGADGKTAASGMLGPNPIVGIDKEEIFDGAKRALKALLVKPDVLVKENVKMLGEMLKVIQGKSDVAPDPKDKRFKHPVWQKSAYYKRVMQSYLAWREAVYSVLHSTNASPKDKERAEFLLQFLTEALAPTNTLIGNPGALMRIMETKGKSLVYGARNMLDDIMNNGGMPRMVDESKFQVGKNLAISEGSVVYRNEVLEVIQYKPQTKKIYARPLVMIPPQINKFYMVDLAPGRSYVEFAMQNGIPFYAVSWRNPTAAQKDWNLETYIKASTEAIEAVCEISGSKDVNLMGACAGGFTLSTLMGYYAAKGSKRVKSASLMVTVLDTRSETLLGMFASKSGIAAAVKRSRKQGVLEGRDMARMFAWLRPNDLVWLFVANNWIMGNNPPAFDMLYWNADTTRLPGEFHADLLTMYLKNPLVHPDSFEVLGEKIDMRKVNCDTYVVAGITDHITPWKACYESREVLKNTKMKFILSGSGHIQSIVNPPGNPRAKYFTNSDLELDADEWLEGVEEHSGTWWFDWLDWYDKEQGGKKINAPKELGSKKHPAMDDAPGRYVFQR